MTNRHRPPGPTPANVRARLRRVQRSHALTQSELASLFGYTQGGISMILSGDRTPTPFRPFVMRLDDIETWTPAKVRRTVAADN